MTHKVTQHMNTTRILELLHKDLMGPLLVECFGGKRYVFVCIDDFSRYSWIHFLKEKANTFDAFEALLLRLMLEENLHNKKVVRIKSDHWREFENSHFENFCNKHGIRHEYSAPKTPQKNGVVEQKNRTLQEMVHVMLKSRRVLTQFWAEALNTPCYIQNIVYLRLGTMTPYEIWRGKKPKLKHLHEFGSTSFVLNDKEQRRKLDPKSDEGMFLGYSLNSRAYRVYNKRSKNVLELANIVIDDQGIVSTVPMLNKSDIEGPLHTSRNDASANDRCNIRE